MSTQFKVGDAVRGDDYAHLPVGAKAVWKHCADSDGLPAEKVNFNAWREGTGLSAPIRTDAEMSLPRTLTHLPEHAEPEDATDADVEPEPLKEGAEHSVERALKAADEFAAAMQKWGEVVREAAEKFGRDLLHGITAEPARCTSLTSRVGGFLVRCDLDEHDEATDHGHNNTGASWTTDNEAGRITESGAS